jgi:N-acyl-D-amino-acid deacylase
VIDRRTFLGAATGAAGAVLLGPRFLRGAGDGHAGTLLRGATLYDGSGRPPVESDVRVDGDRIIAIGQRLPESGASEVVDLRGLALAPGFIDIHSHTELVLLVNPRAESKIRQGVTTEIVGQDGASIGPWTDAQYAEVRDGWRARSNIDIDFRDLTGFFRRLERQGMAVNIASMIGAGTLRSFVIGEANRPATGAELERMAGLVGDSLGAGACGLSSGLEYLPGGFATRDELIALARPLRGTGLPYASHLRNEDDELFAAMEEAIAIGRAAGVPVQLSHLKALGRENWWKAQPALEMIEAARTPSSGEAAVDVTFDVYPYTAYATSLAATLFPLWAREGGTAAFLARLGDATLRERLEAAALGKIQLIGSWDSVQITGVSAPALRWAVGRRLGELAKERGLEPYELVRQLLMDDQSRVRIASFAMAEEDVARFVAHPLAIICSDGEARATTGPLSEGSPHPRGYGAFPRVLGRYVREQKRLPLEQAIRKMTSLPAARLGLRDRGRITVGAFADLVVFDPDRVADRATFERPHQYPVGIVHVLVNGRFVVRDGEHTGALPGKILRPIRAQ